MGMTPGALALQRFDKDPHHALGVAVWDDLCGHGMRVFESDAAVGHERTGIALSLQREGVMLMWQMGERQERGIYEDSLNGERSRSVAAVMTGAVAGSLAALGYHVHAEFVDKLPFPALYVHGRSEK
ncbi:hypothetical protein [Streptomyces coeruleorubidus]|uniref:hypothetical protein n=1 Tax=Streptomyces coeruleorubidus TaxID=116188 RepID=UPI0033B96B72